MKYNVCLGAERAIVAIECDEMEITDGRVDFFYDVGPITGRMKMHLISYAPGTWNWVGAAAACQERTSQQ